MVIYRPVQVPSGPESGLSDRLRFFREYNHTLPRLDEEPSGSADQQRARPLRILSNISGHSAVFMPGASASFVLKTATSSPHLIRLRGEFTRWLSSFDSRDSGCENGFIFVGSEVIIHLMDWKPHVLTHLVRDVFAYANCPKRLNSITHGLYARSH